MSRCATAAPARCRPGGDPSSSAGSGRWLSVAEGPARHYRHCRAPRPPRWVPGSGGCRIHAAQDRPGTGTVGSARGWCHPCPPRIVPWLPHWSFPSPRRGAGAAPPALQSPTELPIAEHPPAGTFGTPDPSGCTQDIVPTRGGGCFVSLPLRPRGPAEDGPRFPSAGPIPQHPVSPLGPPGPALHPASRRLGTLSHRVGPVVPGGHRDTELCQDTAPTPRPRAGRVPLPCTPSHGGAERGGRGRWVGRTRGGRSRGGTCGPGPFPHPLSL